MFLILNLGSLTTELPRVYLNPSLTVSILASIIEPVVAGNPVAGLFYVIVNGLLQSLFNLTSSSLSYYVPLGGLSLPTSKLTFVPKSVRVHIQKRLYTRVMFLLFLLHILLKP